MLHVQSSHWQKLDLVGRILRSDRSPRIPGEHARTDSPENEAVSWHFCMIKRIKSCWVSMLKESIRRHDTRHNDTQHNDIKHNNNLHMCLFTTLSIKGLFVKISFKRLIMELCMNDTQWKWHSITTPCIICHYTECHYAECHSLRWMSFCWVNMLKPDKLTRIIFSRVKSLVKLSIKWKQNRNDSDW